MTRTLKLHHRQHCLSHNRGTEPSTARRGEGTAALLPREPLPPSERKTSSPLVLMPLKLKFKKFKKRKQKLKPKQVTGFMICCR